MASFDIQSGGVKYRVEAANEQEAHSAVAQDQMAHGIVWLFYFIFLLLPRLCVRLASWIFGLLFKAGFVGKIIQTIIVGIVGCILALLLVVGTLVPLLPEFLEPVANLIFLLAGIGGFGYWYYRYHYDTVKFMPASTFSILLTRCFTICFYGGIGLFLLFNGMSNKNLAAGLALDIPFIVALVYWLIKTKAYARPRPDIAGWKASAETGDPIAQYNLGIAYYDGWGVHANKKTAREWYEKAANSGLAEAQIAIGDAYADGDMGFPKDEKIAFEWAKKAAEQNHPTGQFAVGAAYYNGLYGCPKDNEKAREWLGKAAAQGDDMAKEILSKM